MFVFVLVISVGSSLFWNGLSGRAMFPLFVAIIVAIVVTAILIVTGFVVVTLGGNLLLGGDPKFRQWKAQGGRPYWDSLPPPINPDSPETKGFAERPTGEAPADDR
jgi:hypothetical protein